MPLGHAGVVTFVDAADAEKIAGKVLCFNGRYAYFREPLGTGYDPYKMTYLHRFLMDAPDGMQVDHVDGNGLNNCRSNLRLCTHRENRLNQKHRADSKNRYKGVTFHPDKPFKKWQAIIRIDGKRHSLRYHLTEEEAALAYNRAAVIHHGEFARLNEVPNETQNG